MKVSYILLAHESPEKLKPLICSLLCSGSDVYIHHDISCKNNLIKESASWGIDSFDGNLFFADRLHVVWGEWSIIQATLNCIELIAQNGFESDYYYLLSGSCFPVKPVDQLESFLKDNSYDFIECVDAEKNRWVTGGLQKERWSKFNFFNWRYQPNLFDYSLFIQRKIGINRKLPFNHIPHMGSQWWCLRSATLSKLFDLIKDNPSLTSFYKSTWIPDELFFQTLVANTVPKNQISANLLTRYTFTSRGVPKVYYNDDVSKVFISETKFFVRKVSHDAEEFRDFFSNVFLNNNHKEISHMEILSKKNESDYSNLKRSSRFFCQTHEGSLLERIRSNIIVIFSASLSVHEKYNLLTSDDKVYLNIYDVLKLHGIDSNEFIIDRIDSPFFDEDFEYLIYSATLKYPDKTLVVNVSDIESKFLILFSRVSKSLVFNCGAQDEDYFYHNRLLINLFGKHKVSLVNEATLSFDDQNVNRVSSIINTEVDSSDLYSLFKRIPVSIRLHVFSPECDSDLYFDSDCSVSTDVALRFLGFIDYLMCSDSQSKCFDIYISNCFLSIIDYLKWSAKITIYDHSSEYKYHGRMSSFDINSYSKFINESVFHDCKVIAL